MAPIHSRRPLWLDLPLRPLSSTSLARTPLLLKRQTVLALPLCREATATLPMDLATR